VRTTAGVALCAVIGATLVAMAPAAAQEPGPIDCPTVRPVAALAPGAEGVGYTVSRGTEPEPFAVEVVDVLQDAIAPGIPLIVVEVDSPEVDRVGGIWAGMSGSPVYVDGELIGAVGYGFSAGPSKLGGVTPAEAMLEVPGRPTLPPPPGSAPARVTMSAEVQSLAATDHGLSTARSRSMQPLEVPVRLSGPSGTKFERAADAFERAHPGTSVVRGTGSAAAVAEPTAVVAGGNLAVSLAYGDYSAVGVGTATTICDGVVTGFGHPLLFDGATRLGMHGARAVRVVDDSTFGPYKLANATVPVGTIDQDRLAAVAGRLGVLPLTTAITSSITNRDDGRTTTGRTDLVHPDSLLEAVVSHGWVNYDSRSLDDVFFSGTSQVAWSVSGVRSDGTSFSVSREDRHASDEDLSTESLFDVALAAQSVHDNPFEEVRITSVDYTASAGSPYRTDRIAGGQVTASVDGGPFHRDLLELVPGAQVTVRVPLQRYRGSTRTVELDLEVPEDASGSGAITLAGGGFADGEDPLECVVFPEFCEGPTASDLDDLLDGIASAPRNDELVAELVLYPDVIDDPDLEFPGFFDGEGEPVATAVLQVDEVVTGAAQLDVLVPGGGGSAWCEDGLAPPFVDVDPRSVHAASVACAAALGITEGVSFDPPRFAPARPVTRAQAATFLTRMLEAAGFVLPEADRARFVDVRGSVHADNIERLAEAGIVRGRSATTFAPNETVTRAQIATMLVEALRWATGEPLEGDGSVFPDVGGVHADNIGVAADLGLMVGTADGLFRPNAATRRDQAATVLVRTLDTLSSG
jgi:hypothetical protein